MTTIKGPAQSQAQSQAKFSKSPAEREIIIAEALKILAEAESAPGKSFQPLAGVGGTDKSAYRQALPAKHVRDGKFSRAARRAWTLAFSASAIRNPEAFRIAKA